jgi:hypothetical protein
VTLEDPLKILDVLNSLDPAAIPNLSEIEPLDKHYEIATDLPDDLKPLLAYCQTLAGEIKQGKEQLEEADDDAAILRLKTDLEQKVQLLETLDKVFWYEVRSLFPDKDSETVFAIDRDGKICIKPPCQCPNCQFRRHMESQGAQTIDGGNGVRIITIGLGSRS